MDKTFKEEMIKKYYGNKTIPEKELKLDSKTCRKLREDDKKTVQDLKRGLGYK